MRFSGFDLRYPTCKIRKPVDISEMASAPPLVAFINEREPGIVPGLGVLVANDFVLSCEHVIAGGSRDFCVPLYSDLVQKREIVGAYVQNDDRFYIPEHFYQIAANRNANDSVLARDPINALEERLVLVRLRSDRAPGRIANFGPLGAGPFELWSASSAAQPDLVSAMLTVDFTSFSAVSSTQCVQSESYEITEDAARPGDSGGGVFMRVNRELLLVAIQNAIGVLDEKNAVALAIPIEPWRRWINETIAKSTSDTLNF